MKAAFPILLGLALGPAMLSAQDVSERAAADVARQAIRPDEIRARIRFLADSLLRGRAPGTEGYDIAAHYVASELEGMGLSPGAAGGWFQSVPLEKAVTDGAASSLTITVNGKKQKLTDAKDYVLNTWFASPAKKEGGKIESDVDAPLVFVGFGVTAPDQNYDDYAGVDVHGKIAVGIYGAPASFPSTERAYYSDGVVKARNAVEHGAIGTIAIMVPEDWKRYPWDWIVPQIQVGEMHWLESDGVPHDFFPQLRGTALLSEKGAEAVFTGAPKTLDQVFAAARAGRPQAFALPASAHIHTVATQAVIESSNIVARVEGSDPKLKNQAVVYTAHVDHLGLCPPIQGDNVCHGAMDNASGTSSLLEIAHAYARLPQPPRRSVLFVFVTGEEMGLLGSDYFAHFPTAPLSSIVANLNIDGAPGLYYSMKDVVVLGAEHSSLGNEVNSAAGELGYELTPDPMPEEVMFIRSDQYSFVLEGVPAIDITDGIKATDPGIDGLETLRKWLTTRYHTPLDNMDQPMDFASAAKGAVMNFLVGYEVAEHPQVPAWNQGDFFGAKFASKRNAGSGGE